VHKIKARKKNPIRKKKITIKYIRRRKKSNKGKEKKTGALPLLPSDINVTYRYSEWMMMSDEKNKTSLFLVFVGDFIIAEPKVHLVRCSIGHGIRRIKQAFQPNRVVPEMLGGIGISPA
jgi:hypothetical protein